jgi:hypothetical protein
MNLWRELFDPNEPDSLGKRVQASALELTVLVQVHGDLWLWAQQMRTHPGIIAPAGLARYVDVSWLLNSAWAQANAVLTTGFMLLGLLRAWRGAYLAALLGYHLHYVARFSLGKIGHASNVLGFVLLALGLAHVAYADPAVRRKAALGFMLVLLSIGYTWAAVSKLSRTGLSWIDGHHLWLWIRQRAVDGASSLGTAGPESALQRLIAHNLRVATLFLALGLFAELSSSLMIVRRFRRWVLFGLVGMHIGILYVLGIVFLGNIYVLAVLALPIAELVDRYFAGVRSQSAVAPPGTG